MDNTESYLLSCECQYFILLYGSISSQLCPCPTFIFIDDILGFSPSIGWAVWREPCLFPVLWGQSLGTECSVDSRLGCVLPWSGGRCSPTCLSQKGFLCITVVLPRPDCPHIVKKKLPLKSTNMCLTSQFSNVELKLDDGGFLQWIWLFYRSVSFMNIEPNSSSVHQRTGQIFKCVHEWSSVSTDSTVRGDKFFVGTCCISRKKKWLSQRFQLLGVGS